jgi:hypothetical protein
MNFKYCLSCKVISYYENKRKKDTYVSQHSVIGALIVSFNIFRHGHEEVIERLQCNAMEEDIYITPVFDVQERPH